MNLQKTLGAAATEQWLLAHDLQASTPHWYVEITIESDSLDVRFELNIYPEEWGFVFRRGARVSSIRVTDVPFVHGRDDHALLSRTPELEHVGDLLKQLEGRYSLSFARSRATVRSNLIRATTIARSWLSA